MQTPAFPPALRGEAFRKGVYWKLTASVLPSSR
jgi:hypothetical protein